MEDILGMAEIAIRPAVILFMVGNLLTLAATWLASRWLGKASAVAALKEAP